MIYDIFTYNGERDILEIRLNILSPFVDKFIVVEAKTTFSGKPKPLYFSLHEKHFEKFWSNMEYFVIDENYSKEEREVANSSPNTVGAKHWKNEFLQKESIHKAMIKYGVKDEDTVYIGDVDEIWEPFYGGTPSKLKLLVYAYYLNNVSSEEFWGTLVAKYGEIKNLCLNHLRNDITLRTHDVHGWHFTSMGGFDMVKRKLNDSYTSESYNTQSVQNNLSERVEKGIDYLGRSFTFKIDEYDWPRYLELHRNKYKKLCL